MQNSQKSAYQVHILKFVGVLIDFLYKPANFFLLKTCNAGLKVIKIKIVLMRNIDFEIMI